MNFGKMRIQINNFRSWKKLDIEVPSTGITLLKGASGSGKTSIIKAITWAMYDRPKKNIAPLHDSTSKTLVIVTLPNMVAELQQGDIIIKRTRVPCTFSVEVGGVKYQGEGASSKIIEMFGNYDTWYNSCQLSIRDTTNFLTCTPNVRASILDSITMQDGVVQDRIDKISQYHKNVKIEYDRICHMYSHLDTSTPLLTEKERDELLEDIEKLEKNYIETIDIEKQRESKLKILSEIDSIVRDTKMLDLPLLYLTDEEVNTMTEKLSNLKIISALLHQLTSTRWKYVREEDEQDIVREIEYSSETRSLLKYHRLQEDIKKLNDELTSIDTLLSVDIDTSSLLEENTSITNAINSLTQPKVITFTRDNELNDINKRITEINQILNLLKTVLSCPHCNGLVKVQHTKLIKSDINADTSILDEELKSNINKKRDIENERQSILKMNEENLTSYNNSIRRLRLQQQNVMKRLKEANEINEKKTSVVNRRSIIVEMIERVKRLHGIVQYSYQDIKMSKLKREVEGIYGDLQQYRDISQTIIKLQGELSRAELSRIEYKKIERINEGVEGKIRSLSESRMKLMNEIPEQLLSTSQEISSYIEELSDVGCNQRQLAEYNIHREKMEYAIELKGVAIESQMETYEQMTFQTNYILADMCQSLFNGDCSVSIDLTKTTKITKVTKNEVNLSIIMKSTKRDKDSISGGEFDRVLLAVACALTSFNSFPYLTIDENLSSLDSDTRDITLKTLHTLVKKIDKGIILILHDTVEGLYSHVIDVEELQHND